MIDSGFQPQTVGQFGDARADFEWYAQRFCTIRDKDAPRPHVFVLNKIQRLLDMVINTQRDATGGIRLIGIKTRQGGFSTYVTNRSAWKCLTRPNYLGIHIAHDADTTAAMLDMVKLTYNSLPEGSLSFSDGAVLLKPTEIKSNRAELVVAYDAKETLISTTRIMTGGRGEGTARGLSPSLLHFSEIGAHDVFDDGQVIGGAMQGLPNRGAEVLAEGTPNGSFGWAYDTYEKAIHGENNWVPVFLPWFLMDKYRMPLLPGETIEPENEYEYQLMQGENTMVRMGKNVSRGIKVGRDQIKWRRFKRGDMPNNIGQSPEEWLRQEFPSNETDCWLTLGSAYFLAYVVEAGRKFADKYVESHPIKRYTMVDGKFTPDRWGQWFFIEEVDPDATYVIGGDVAEGKEDGDYDTAVVIKRCESGPDWVVAYWHSKDPDKGRHARIMADAGLYWNRGLLAVERNKDGIAVNDYLGNFAYPRLYVQTQADEATLLPGYKHQYGFLSTSKTKELYLASLQTALRNWYENPTHPEGLVIPFPYIWEELRTFQVVKSQKGAAYGAHDDLVTSTGIACYVKYKVPVPRQRVEKKQDGVRYFKRTKDPIAVMIEAVGKKPPDWLQ